MILSYFLIPENQYKALLNLRLLMFPETYIGLSQTPDLGQIGFQCHIVITLQQTQMLRDFKILIWEKR